MTEQDLREEIEQLTRERDENARIAEERLSQITYLQADFDNYRKWSDKERSSQIALANECLIKDLLVILDDLQQAMPSLKQEENQEGMLMIQKKLVKILSEYGLESIECIGKKFNPNFHEVLYQERCNAEPKTILEEFGRGYLLRSKVIRPSKVKIAEQLTEDEGENNG